MSDRKYFVGFGTWKITDREILRASLIEAIESGYRMIDTAAVYCNEISIGKVLRELPVRREELFIQGKLWRTSMGFEESKEACKKSLYKMKLDYFDAYLIHWPDSDELNAETWTGFEELQREGLVRHIGVSNFKPHHIDSLMKSSHTWPEMNQIELHPGFLQNDILTYCREHNIRIQAHSPLGNGQILTNVTLNEIADSHGKTPAQICIRWALDKGSDVLPKSVNPKRIRENMNVFDFSLTEDETQRIDMLPFSGGLGLNSDEVIDFAKL